MVDCGEMNDCAIRLPSDNDKWLEFNNFNRKERLLFIVYADWECVLAKMEEEQHNFYQHHRVFSIPYYVHCPYDDSLYVYNSRRSADCVLWFTEELKNLAIRVKTILTTNVPMVDLTFEEWEKFNNATHCHICEKPFAEDDTRVRDHCHLTGQYRHSIYSSATSLILCSTKWSAHARSQEVYSVTPSELFSHFFFWLSLSLSV